MIPLLVTLVLVIILVALIAGIYNKLVRLREPLQERLCPDRCAAQAPLRPDSQPGRDGQGLHEARARNARSRHRGAQPGVHRQPAGGRSAGRSRAMRGLMGAEAALTGALGRLFAVVEAYPDLKANQNMAQLRRS